MPHAVLMAASGGKEPEDSPQTAGAGASGRVAIEVLREVAAGDTAQAVRILRVGGPGTGL